MIDQLPFVRKMAKVLCDRGIDPLYKDDIEITTTLICAGWSTGVITRNFEPVKRMASIWFFNEARKRQKRIAKAIGET